MRLSLCVGVLLLAPGASVPGQETGNRIGELLEPGMQLFYSSQGIQPAPWTIFSVTRGVTIAGRSDCVRISLRTAPNQVVPETRVHCVRGTAMVNVDETTGSVRPGRPLVPEFKVAIPQPNGGQVVYETSQSVLENIQLQRGSAQPVGTPVDVLLTTVTTLDSAGKVIRRLRERFSIALGTATGGVFEMPDSTQAGGWRVVNRFELARIAIPH